MLCNHKPTQQNWKKSTTRQSISPVYDVLSLCDTILHTHVFNKVSRFSLVLDTRGGKEQNYSFLSVSICCCWWQVVWGLFWPIFKRSVQGFSLSQRWKCHWKNKKDWYTKSSKRCVTWEFNDSIRKFKMTLVIWGRGRDGQHTFNYTQKIHLMLQSQIPDVVCNFWTKLPRRFVSEGPTVALPLEPNTAVSVMVMAGQGRMLLW